MPTRWEYLVLDSRVTGFLQPEVDSDELTGRLNGFGEDGWELVGMSALERANGRTRDLLLVLKRPRS